MPPKKASRKPAHQNTFAFKHNPNSKLTARILASPNVHVCRRCHEKIEWRKKYRKYKPLTQPGKCNLCQLKRVTAAYHTICEPCTRNATKTRSLLDDWNQSGYQPGTTKEVETDDSKQKGEEGDEGCDIADVEESIEEEAAPPAAPQRIYRRVCAMCVKEPALPGESDDEEEDDEAGALANLDRPLRLRERKRLERLAEKKCTAARATTTAESIEDE